MSCQERMRMLDLFSLEKRLMKDPVLDFSYKKSGYGENEGKFLVEVYSERQDTVVINCSKGN